MDNSPNPKLNINPNITPGGMPPEQPSQFSSSNGQPVASYSQPQQMPNNPVQFSSSMQQQQQQPNFQSSTNPKKKKILVGCIIGGAALVVIILLAVFLPKVIYSNRSDKDKMEDYIDVSSLTNKVLYLSTSSYCSFVKSEISYGNSTTVDVYAKNVDGCKEDLKAAFDAAKELGNAGVVKNDSSAKESYEKITKIVDDFGYGVDEVDGVLSQYQTIFDFKTALGGRVDSYSVSELPLSDIESAGRILAESDNEPIQSYGMQWLPLATKLKNGYDAYQSDYDAYNTYSTAQKSYNTFVDNNKIEDVLPKISCDNADGTVLSRALNDIDSANLK